MTTAALLSRLSSDLALTGPQRDRLLPALAAAVLDALVLDGSADLGALGTIRLGVQTARTAATGANGASGAGPRGPGMPGAEPVPARSIVWYTPSRSMERAIRSVPVSIARHEMEAAKAARRGRSGDRAGERGGAA